MSNRKLDIIRPSLELVRLSDGDLLLRANAVYDSMIRNAAYPSPWVSMDAFKAAIDAFTAAVAATLDGGRQATVARDACRADLTVMLRSLGHYVEIACKNDMATFVSSGFLPALTGHRIPEPLPAPSRIRIDQGQTGQLWVRIQPVPKGRRYDLRYAKLPEAGAAAEWTTILAAATKPPIAIDNLTPASTYMFQARVFGKLGFSDWSSTFQRMCT